MFPALRLFHTLTLAWNPSPDATGYRVWRGIEVVAVVDRPQAAVLLPACEASALTVTAVNAAGESPRSGELVVWIPPPPVLTVQGSADLVMWREPPQPGDRFFRIKIEPSISSSSSP